MSKRKPEPKRPAGRPAGATEPTKYRGVRLPADVDDRVAAVVERENAGNPYANATRTSVIVAVLRAHLPPLPGGAT